MPLATDLRGYADSAVAQGRTALAQATDSVRRNRLVADAPKPAYAALGAADLIAATVTKRVEDLPVDAVNGVTRAHSGVTKAQRNGQELLARAQNDAQTRLTELRQRVEERLETVGSLPGTARNAGETYLATARSTGQAYLGLARNVYGSLTGRGEARAAELRKDPRVSKLLGTVDSAVDSVQDAVAPIARSAFDAVAPDETVTPTPARKPAGRSTSTGKAAASKTTEAKASASKTTAAKSTGLKTTTAKAAGNSSADTAATRKPAAKKAPAKRAASAKV